MEEEIKSEYKATYANSRRYLTSLTGKTHIRTLWHIEPTNAGEALTNLFIKTGIIENKEYGSTDMDISCIIENWKIVDGNDICIFDDGKGNIKWASISDVEFLKGFILGFGKVKNCGYITGRGHYLGPFASGGLQSASMQIGYTMWISGK